MQSQFTNAKSIIHMLIGTPNTLTIHTRELIFVGYKMTIKNATIEVTKVVSNEKSKYYSGFSFYELKFDVL